MNNSLISGQVLTFLKHAVAQPVIQKPNLDRTDLNNYRPISIRAFLSMILEKAVFQKLLSFLTENNMFYIFQSGFRAKAQH